MSAHNPNNDVPRRVSNRNSLGSSRMGGGGGGGVPDLDNDSDNEEGSDFALASRRFATGALPRRRPVPHRSATADPALSTFATDARSTSSPSLAGSAGGGRDPEGLPTHSSAGLSRSAGVIPPNRLASLSDAQSNPPGQPSSVPSIPTRKSSNADLRGAIAATSGFKSETPVAPRPLPVRAESVPVASSRPSSQARSVFAPAVPSSGGTGSAGAAAARETSASSASSGHSGLPVPPPMPPGRPPVREIPQRKASVVPFVNVSTPAAGAPEAAPVKSTSIGAPVVTTTSPVSPKSAKIGADADDEPLAIRASAIAAKSSVAGRRRTTLLRRPTSSAAPLSKATAASLPRRATGGAEVSSKPMIINNDQDLMAAIMSGMEITLPALEDDNQDGSEGKTRKHGDSDTPKRTYTALAARKPTVLTGRLREVVMSELGVTPLVGAETESDLISRRKSTLNRHGTRTSSLRRSAPGGETLSRKFTEQRHLGPADALSDAEREQTRRRMSRRGNVHHSRDASPLRMVSDEEGEAETAAYLMGKKAGNEKPASESDDDEEWADADEGPSRLLSVRRSTLRTRQSTLRRQFGSSLAPGQDALAELSEDLEPLEGLSGESSAAPRPKRSTLNRALGGRRGTAMGGGSVRRHGMVLPSAASGAPSIGVIPESPALQRSDSIASSVSGRSSLLRPGSRVSTIIRRRGTRLSHFGEDTAVAETLDASLARVPSLSGAQGLQRSESIGSSVGYGSLRRGTTRRLAPGGGTINRRRTSRLHQSVGGEISVEVLEMSDADGDEFLDAEGWEDDEPLALEEDDDDYDSEAMAAAVASALSHPSAKKDNRAALRAKFRSAAHKAAQTAQVSRNFYETLASRAGEVFSHAGNAAQVISTPLGFIAGPAVAGLVSAGGAAAAAAGTAAVKKFGRKGTRNRVTQAQAALSQLTAAKLLESATKTMAGDQVAEDATVKMISQGIAAVVEGGMVAGTVSIVASGLAVNVKDSEARQRILANSYIQAAADAMGHLANVAPILPKSLHGFAEAAGAVSTATKAAAEAVGADQEATEDAEEDLSDLDDEGEFY